MSCSGSSIVERLVSLGFARDKEEAVVVGNRLVLVGVSKNLAYFGVARCTVVDKASLRIVVVDSLWTKAFLQLGIWLRRTPASTKVLYCCSEDKVKPHELASTRIPIDCDAGSS